MRCTLCVAQVYSSVFESLIANFKTYGPLLAEIKEAYDQMVSWYRIPYQRTNRYRCHFATRRDQAAKPWAPMES